MEKTDIVLGATAIVFAVTCGVLLQRLKAEQALVQSQAARIVVLERVEAIGGGESRTNVSTAQALSAVSVVSSDGSASPSSASPGAAAVGPIPHDLLRKDAEYQTAMMARVKQMKREEIQDLPHWMAISAQTMDTLAGVLVEQDLKGSELPYDEEDPRWEAFSQENAVEVSQLLGAQRFQQWKAYSEAREARESMGAMNARLQGGDALAPGQVPKIAMAMAKANQAVWRGREESRFPANSLDAAGRRAEREKDFELAKRSHQATRAAALPHLSSKQRQALDEVYAVKLEQLKAVHDVEQAEEAMAR